MNFLPFFLTWSLITGLAFFYLGKRTIRVFDKSRRLAWIIIALMYLLVIIPFLLLMLRAEGLALDMALLAGYAVLGFSTIAIFLFLAVDVWRFVFRIASVFRSPSEKETDIERRRFLIQSAHFGVLGAAASVSAYGFLESHSRPRLERVDIPLPNLPPAFEGFRILQFTDLHVGPTIKQSYVESVVEQIALLSADAIVFTGDLVDGSVGWLRDDVSPIAQLSAPSGKFFITGNHEYYSGVGPWVREVERLGYQTLINQHHLIANGEAQLILAGVTDYGGGQFDPSHRSSPEKSLEGAPANVTKILLAHQPRSVFSAASLKFDLQISGHTHGGQFFPLNFLVGLNQPYISGLHRHDDTWIYVSRGTGYWGPPLRLGIPPEITIFRLTRPKQVR